MCGMGEEKCGCLCVYLKLPVSSESCLIEMTKGERRRKGRWRGYVCDGGGEVWGFCVHMPVSSEFADSLCVRVWFNVIGVMQENAKGKCFCVNRC